MKPLACLLLFVLAPVLAEAKTILVNTTNNVSSATGETNLVQAINLLADGDRIHFAIPGTGPFYLITPPLTPDNGYPSITNHNVTIDGYSQPGAFPNTNPILSTNNAQIQIVLDSRAGGFRLENLPGYGLSEKYVLLVKGATNVTVRGFSFLGPGTGSYTPEDPGTYGVSFALNAMHGHVSGCWFGLAPDRTNIFRFLAGVTGFQGGTNIPQVMTVGVHKTAASETAARAQFNIFMGIYIPVIIEGNALRIAGNFFNVFPDGQTDFLADGSPGHELQAFIEVSSADNLVIGTDGDGVNDAEERNIFGGVTHADDNELLETYGITGTNMVVAGNYFGMAVDGVTRFTNSMKLFGNVRNYGTLRIGSDFDGVSDALEANVIAMNHPFDTLFPAPTVMTPRIFGTSQAGAQISVRGNRMIGNTLAPFTFADGFGGQLAAFTNYSRRFMDTNQPIIPQLLTNSTTARLRGLCAPGVTPYTNIIVDVYLADEEGWTNGMRFELAELSYTNPLTFETRHHGFPQGRVYLGSFVDNGPANPDATTGEFEFDISALGINADQLVTVTANYSADAPGTPNARTHTSNFAFPITLQLAPRLVIVKSGGNVLLSWPTNAGSFTIESTPGLHPSAWTALNPQATINVSGTNFQAAIPIATNSTFFRLLR
ncbi:MAG: hypothetical protein H7Y43_10115 [Akkermansiaceae bacterium]|nr:hypothetical protein [Verrucomicrobiales bacterium]